MIPGLGTTAPLTLNIAWQSSLAATLQQQGRGNIFVTLLLIVLAIILLVVFWEWWKRIEGEDLGRDKRILNVHETDTATSTKTTAYAETAVHVEADPHVEPTAEEPAVPPEAPVTVETAPAPTAEAAPPAPAEPDDLTKIEGIGPKISELLHNAGILTFAQLAKTDVARVEQILADAGPRFQLADPSTWAQQANLAAAAAWEELAILQDNLKGGRQVPQ